VGFVTINMDTTQLQGKTVKSIHVKTSDPLSPSLFLTLRANILGSIEILPNSVIYMRRRAGRAPVARGLIRQEPTEAGTLSVSGVTTSEKRLVASARKLVKPRPRSDGLPAGRPGDWLLEVRFRDDVPVYGKLDAKVRFDTALTRQPRGLVDVESNLEGPISLSTPRLSLLPSINGEARGTVFASIRQGANPGGFRAIADPPELEVKLQRTTERLVKIDVRWGGGPLENASIEFEIDGESLRMPVVWKTGTD
jgi:hypothetical protein